MITVDKNRDIPLYVQIRDAIQELIKSGQLQPGDKLPPVTTLARDIGVTQATIRRALQDLTDAGQAKCHVGRGTFIQEIPESEEGASITADKTVSLPLRPQASNHCYEFAARKLRMGMSKALDDIMSLAVKPGLIHFTRGIPDPSLLPANLLPQLNETTLTRDGNELLVASDPLGRFELRQEIARRASTAHMTITPDQVLITNGSIQAISLLGQANLESGRKILCETPCFKGIIESFAASGHWVDTVMRDQDGPLIPLPSRTNGLEPFLLYLCPYAHNPMGTNLEKNRFVQLVDWCRKTGSLIVADEIFRDLCFSPPETPSLLEALGPEQCAVVSSLSKTVTTGFRVGWIISSARRIHHLAQLKRVMDQSTPPITQGMALSLLQSETFDKHLKRIQATYLHRRDLMLQILAREMPAGIHWTTPDGGFSLMLELPVGYSSVALFLAAIDRGISFLPGPLFDIDQRFINYCRLSYAWTSDEQIKEGIELLADAVTSLLKKPAGDSGLSGLGSYQ